MLEVILLKLRHGEDATCDEMEMAVSMIAEGRASEQETADLLVNLARKGVTAEELTGAARAMRRFVSRINIERDVILDTCGTGGDGKHTFNISTIVAFIVAGCGTTVAKHGNRAVSGSCGSADLLEALGVNIQADVKTVERCLEEIGIGFLFAPHLHPAMRYVQPVRAKLKMRTIFNILGPLINPAFPTHQLIGVYDKKLISVVGGVLKNLGLRHAMVVWGEGGFDEVTTTAETFVCELKDGHLREYVIEPEKVGLHRVFPQELAGGDAETNKHIALSVLKGVEGAKRDVVLLNAGCCLYLAGSSPTIRDGMERAAESIDSGAAIKKLNKLIEYTNS